MDGSIHGVLTCNMIHFYAFQHQLLVNDLSHGTVEDVAEVSIDFRIRFVGETHCPRQQDGKNID